MKTLLVTGSSGLIGSEAVSYFCHRGWQVHGIDANMRADFFGAAGDTRWNQLRLQQAHPTFRHYEIDIRNRIAVFECLRTVRPDAVIHAAAQPSHDLATSRPLDDFDVNAMGTLNLLEAARQSVPDTIFIHLSTSKVYGDRPNFIALEEHSTRWDYADPRYFEGIPEDFPIDHTRHSIFGASKVAADVMVQEYGRTYGMNTCSLRGACLTGPNHSGVELHGFLSYLVKCHVRGQMYTVLGYKGKQVRDNIHALDVIRFIECFMEAPRQGQVYNIGGGRANSISILEAFAMLELISGRPVHWQYSETPRGGDHVCYISDLSLARKHYPAWSITRSLRDILADLYEAEVERNEQFGTTSVGIGVLSREGIGGAKR